MLKPKLGLAAAGVFPRANYTEMAPQSVTAWGEISQAFETALGIQYAPIVSVAWDSSPRTLASDPFGQWGYPWSTTYTSTPAEFTQALTLAKTYMTSSCSDESKWCPPL